jgi:hypothetical protein
MAFRLDGGAELDFTAVALDDGAGDPEAEAGAALAFSGEEGLTETALDLRRDAAAVVAYGDANAADARIGPAAGETDAKAEAAVGQGSLNGIRHEVREDLAHLAGIDDGFDGAIVLALDA